MKALTKELQSEITPQKGIELLKEGNKRFVEGKKADRDLMQQVKDTADGQNPFAIILSCIDSRTSSELIFDQGIGDVFNARIAGNIVNEDILGSMEFACKLAGSKLVLVLGHTRCGAVKGACDNAELGNLTGLVNKIKPSIDSLQYEGDKSSKNAEFVQLVAEHNVHRMVDEIKSKSSVLREMAENGEIAIVGGMYDVTTGQVEFYEESV